MTAHPQDLGLRAQAAAIATGELDPQELLGATFARIDARDSELNAIAARDDVRAQEMLAGAPAGALHGVPIAVKDMFALPWWAPRSGSEHAVLEPGESAVFRRLRDAGAVVAGISNMHLFGLGTTGRVSAYGPIGNPWDVSRCGGGSSGGATAAVGARLVAGAIASDSGGSTRLPSAYCGVTGLKFTFGAVPGDGYTARNMSLSAPGAVARDAGDTRLLAEVLLDRRLPEADGSHLTAGIVGGPLWDDVEPQTAARCREALKAAGWATVEIELDLLEHAVAAGVVRLASEALATFPPPLLAGIDPLVRATLQYSMLFRATTLVRADRVRAALRRSVVAAFDRCDVLAWPAVPAPAPPIDDPTVELPSGPAPADLGNLRQAIVANLAGLPGISLPAGLADDMPAGLQLLAPWGEEARLLDAAAHLERATDRAHVDAIPAIAR